MKTQKQRNNITHSTKAKIYKINTSVNTDIVIDQMDSCNSRMVDIMSCANQMYMQIQSTVNASQSVFHSVAGIVSNLQIQHNIAKKHWELGRNAIASKQDVILQFASQHVANITKIASNLISTSGTFNVIAQGYASASQSLADASVGLYDQAVNVYNFALSSLQKEQKNSKYFAQASELLEEIHSSLLIIQNIASNSQSVAMLAQSNTNAVANSTRILQEVVCEINNLNNNLNNSINNHHK